jgi:septation ring formation regulator EzrA
LKKFAFSVFVATFGVLYIIINTRFYPELTALENRIREILAMSIAENLADTYSVTI